MIICEECGARNRNDAYVCAVCQASLLHVKPAPDDEPAPARRKMMRFGRRKRQRNIYDEPEYALDAENSPEPAEEEMPGVKNDDKPQELQHEAAPAAKSSKPEAVAEEQSTVTPSSYDEAQKDSAEIDSPEHTEIRTCSREVHVRVARVNTDNPERMTRGMIAAIAAVASLLAVTLIVLGVLYIGKSRSVPAAASTAPAAITEDLPAATPE